MQNCTKKSVFDNNPIKQERNLIICGEGLWGKPHTIPIAIIYNVHNALLTENVCTLLEQNEKHTQKKQQ